MQVSGIDLIFKAIDEALMKDHWLIALDRDGTLVPYAPRPEEAVVDDKLRALIATLCASPRAKVAVISARSAAQLKGDFDGVGAILAGNYGMEVVFPERECIHPGALNAVPALKTVRDDLSEQIDLEGGAILEDHGYSLCLHWHNVPPEKRDDLHATVLILADMHKDAKFRRLPTSYEVLPNMQWDKGLAFQFIAENIEQFGEDPMYFFAGDTTADSPAFVWTNERGGISIRVGEGDELGARYRVDKPTDLHDILEYVARRLIL